MKLSFELLISIEGLLPGGMVGHVSHRGQALQGQLQVVLDVVGPVDCT